ncbi:cell wall-active antibiotics response protein [Echinicola marina]|uniref:LiaF transmembrane domain-containing protein n=1 Tax=Echinicola marina TaxID=2859768 RepID=UPI001CF61C05|nr:DUF5668 domain-containing protein [Echinicola marina]UCS93497.1 cell wall-active antibiotics response protein [Echinicola marina]
MSGRMSNADGGRFTTGLIVVSVGLILLIRKLGIEIPDWIFSWPMIFVAIGLVVMAKHNFRSGFGAFMLLFGGFFLLKDELHFFPVGLGAFVVPIILILLGLFLMMTRKQPKFNGFSGFGSANQEDIKGKGKGVGETFMSDSSYDFRTGSKSSYSDDLDMLNSQALFCGIQKRVQSKNFKGGKISAIFGGTEIDLTQADLAENAVLNVEVAFGGVKLLVPPHWELRMGVTNVFAGVEDKRMYPKGTEDTGKVLTITGTVVFGGLEIKSF